MTPRRRGPRCVAPDHPYAEPAGAGEPWLFRHSDTHRIEQCLSRLGAGHKVGAVTTDSDINGDLLGVAREPLHLAQSEVRERPGGRGHIKATDKVAQTVDAPLDDLAIGSGADDSRLLNPKLHRGHRPCWPLSGHMGRTAYLGERASP